MAAHPEMHCSGCWMMVRLPTVGTGRIHYINYHVTNIHKLRLVVCGDNSPMVTCGWCIDWVQLYISMCTAGIFVVGSNPLKIHVMLYPRLP